MYQYPPYPQDQGLRVPVYPAPGFGQPGFSPSIPPPLSMSASHQSASQINSSSPSSPALDSARLMALLTNHSSGGLPVPTSLELPPTDSHTSDTYCEVSRPPAAVAPAVPSAPPVSLAPTSASGRIASNKLPKGRNLKGDHIVYDINIRLAGEAQPQLEASPITKYASDPQLLVGRQIAVNRSYICYGLRPNRHIRILNINTALRYLLRGHSERVTDMAFFAEDVHLLASASSDGRVFVRRIVEGPGEDDKVQITDQILLAIQFTGDWEVVHPHVCWHTHSEDHLVVGLSKYVLTIDIKKVRQSAAPGGFMAEEPVLCPVDNPIEGVYCVSGHDGEVTDLSSSQWTRLVSASKDGMIRFWREQDRLPFCTLTPHDGLPVGAVGFLSAPHRADHIVLLTAGPLNRELKLWVPAVGEGWFPLSGSIKWKCIQTLELKSSSGGEPDDAFFNQVLVVPRARVILLPNAKRNALYVVHVDFGSNPSATHLDYLAEFSVTMPILSLTATSENVFEGDGIVQVYCVQTQAIQQYSLDLSLCVPPIETSTFSVEKDLKGSVGNSTMDMEASSTALEVSAMLRAKSPGPISGVSLTDKPLGGGQLPSISLEPTSMLDPRVVIGSSKKEMKEIPAKEQSPNVSRIVAPIPHVGAVALSPRSSPLAKTVLKSSTANNSPREQVDYVRIFEQSGESKKDSDVVVQDSYPLSPRRASNEIMRISEDRDWQVISTTAASSIMSEQHSGGGSMHLITPSELMSMVVRSKGEVDGGLTVSSPQGAGGMSKDLSKPESRLEDYMEKADLEVLTVETKEVTDSTVLTPEKQKITLLMSDSRKRDQTNAASEYACMDTVKEEGDMVEQLHFEHASGEEAHQGISGEVAEERLSSVPGVDELCEQLKEVSVKVDDSSAPPVASQTRKKKNKNKTDANIPMVMTLPSAQMPGSSTSIMGTSELDSSNGLSSSVLSPTLVAQINAMQESLNQLLTMQGEFQKQMGAILAVPVAKEVKRMEVALGQRMEKVLKAHVDAMWARLQEDNAKREKLERDRAQQLTSMFSNLLNKELPAALEKATKKELSSIGSYVSRLVTPSIEKAISVAVNESFQKGVAEKGVSQLEKSVGAKVEAVVSRQLQTQFQTSGKQALQEGLRSCLEASVIPAFERACQEMFGQVDAAFQKGMLDHRTHAQQQLITSHSALTASLQEAVASASSLAAFLKGDLADGQRKLLAVIENAGGARGAYMTKPINGGLPEKAMTVQHVEESLDPTKELARLISERKLEEAFNKALSLTDVGVVSWLCNQVDPTTLFTMSPPPLSQGVLLALVQQLGCDLGHDTGKKLMWIKGAALALNPRDPGLAPHMRHFLEKLYSNLHALAKTALSPELANTTRLVIHVVHSLLMYANEAINLGQ